MSSLFPKVPHPPTPLGYHRILSPKAGVRVSPLCLGTMGFGDNWKGYMGECNKDQSFEILDFFYENGGNFIDTANNYQFEESEIWVGEWMRKRNNRDEIVLATKYTTGYRTVGAPELIKANFQGNHLKSMRLSVDASLKKLQTDYIDLLYLHWWDYSTGVEEIMRGLHTLVTSGKVLYLGISDTPAWIIVKCNEYARQHSLTPFSVYQGLWNASVRDIERDILPMCRSEGLAIAPWGALGRGQYKLPSHSAEEAAQGRQGGPADEKTKAIVTKLDEIARAKNTEITSVAMAYVMHKTPYVFPIVGGRKISHLKGNVEALKIKLSDEDIHAIEAAVPFDIGFPQNMFFGGFSAENAWRTDVTTADMPIVQSSARLEMVPGPKPIVPGQGAARP